MGNIVVTGAAGIIGQAVVEGLLAKSYSITAIDSRPNPFGSSGGVRYIQCEITDKEQVVNAMSGASALVHLACSVDNDMAPYLSSADEKLSAQVDKFIYKAAEAAHVDVIMMLSTHQVYAQPHNREPVRETFPEKPSTIYGKLKYSSEKALEAAIKKSSTRGIIMRICPVYSKRYIENLKARVQDPSDGSIFVYGYGDYGYSFTCLYNIPDFIYGVLTADRPVSGVYNVVDTKPTSAKDIVELLKTDYNVTVVQSRNYSSDVAKKQLTVFGSKAMRTEYRYNDPVYACTNINYDNTRAQQISTFRWKLSNTK
ncbi:MAG: NAD(P)-dependent oxidoreductase [Oscillospiraceae bacterium]|nr:NAD(P)-dependent oxidoreductase [Oscillospiraceae bacterium]